ncbi:hypothetical protein SM11_pC0625 (plasmid) [Sinorhizobium meliloti SM11]|jgi:hypothetical protein|uniref:Uncharacterized protein n=1 Tax=Sinorhizobium meliloti (strain SM11) TaxID=707241 RepID=F7XDS3_SINMM|nr:hypothetical protein SM11_pC0625 [Sinorhizobium meliloti SM11]
MSLVLAGAGAGLEFMYFHGHAGEDLAKHAKQSGFGSGRPLASGSLHGEQLRE